MVLFNIFFKMSLANKIVGIKRSLTSKFFVLFVVIFLLRLDNMASKSVFVIKLTCANLALKTSSAKALNSEVVIYMSWLWLLSLFQFL